MSILCACGLPKTMTGIIALCGHCDTYCPQYGPNCARCRQYTIATNQRVTTEHGREKSNG